jgi:outer membrane protein assembly factor BamB
MRTHLTVVVAATVVLLPAYLPSAAAAQGHFERLATLRSLGLVVGQTVAPGPGGRGERIYISYLYVNHTIDVVSVDPDTGQFQVFPNPASSETGARTMIAGLDGKIYLGTLTGAHFYCLDPKAGTLADLGRPSATESYIWALTFGSDGKLYGATYPGAKLVRYDPKTGKLEDLGRMDPVEEYAHYVAGSDDGFLYLGIGASKANIAAYRISTGEHREIAPEKSRTAGQAVVFRGRDGKVYGYAGLDWYRMDGWNAIPIERGTAAPPVLQNALSDGRTLDVTTNILRITDPKSGALTARPFDYRGNEVNLFRVGLGPDGKVYGSGVLPGDLVRFNARSRGFDILGRVAGGELYALLPLYGRLLVAGYSSLAPLMSYDPSQPFHPGSGADGNPSLIHYAGQDDGWRPQAEIAGSDGQVYIGAVAGYGSLGGPLTIWNVVTGVVETHPQIVHDQSVVTLAAAGDSIVGGTTVIGGGGSHPTEREAKLFIWDTKTKQKIFETVPVSGAKALNDLIAVKGRVFGIAGGTPVVVDPAKDPEAHRATGVTLFVFDLATHEVSHLTPVDFDTIYNSVAVGPDGKIWGLSSSGIFRIDPESCRVSRAALAPEPITGGFAMDSTGIYYASGSSLYRYAFR